MLSARLRKIDGSIMLAVPPAILERLQLRDGTDIELAVVSGRLVVEVAARPRYTLGDLLAQCDPAADISNDETVWLEESPRGAELI